MAAGAALAAIDPSSLAASVSRDADRRPPRKPNIVLIMADDMGFSDIGPYGGEIRTPNLDRLAADGLRFSQFYNCARCVPTRGALLTGLYPHQAGVGHMLRQVMSGYEGQLSDRSVTLAQALKTAGYATAMSGKWHLSHLHIRGKDQLDFRSNAQWWDTKSTWPVARGFEEFYGTIAGVENFFDPFSLVHNETLTQPESADYYYTDAIAEHAARTIAANAASDRPYFHYVAFTAPHWPMHALPDDIARYEGTYGIGWDAVRAARHERLVRMGMVDARWRLTSRDESVPAWTDAADKEWQAHTMAVYAAMIDRMDQGIGRILDAIHASGTEDDTIVIFLSDNGASAEDVQPEWYDVPAHTRAGATIRVGNRTDVRAGPQETWLSYQAPWANASNTPFRLYKKWMHEGGIATPFIVRWPSAIRERGGITHQPGHVIDVMATVLDAAGTEYPREYAGREITPMEGKSLVPILHGRRREGHDALYWEHEGNRAMRDGRWKIVSRHPGAWELYDLDADRTETRDLASTDPRRVAAMQAKYEAWMHRTGVLPWDEYVRIRDAKSEG